MSHRRRRSRRCEREGRLQSPKISYARPRCPPYATRRGGMVSVFMAWCGVVNGRCSPTVREDPSTKPEMGQAGGWENALGHILLHLEHLIIAGAELHLLGGHVERRWRGAAKVPSFRFVSKTKQTSRICRQEWERCWTASYNTARRLHHVHTRAAVRGLFPPHQPEPTVSETSCERSALCLARPGCTSRRSRGAKELLAN